MNVPKILLFLLLMYIPDQLAAQDSVKIIEAYFEKNRISLGLSEEDMNDFFITNEVFSKSTGITNVYIQQSINGIPVYNAVATLAVKNNEVIHFGDRLIRNLNKKVSGTTTTLSATDAVASAASQLNVADTGSITLIDTKNINQFLVSKAGISKNDIPVKLVYQLVENSLKLAWNLNIRTLDSKHWWSLRIDANSGEILEQNDWVLNCSFPNAHQHNNQSLSISHGSQTTALPNINTMVDGSTYNVFAFPVESPLHGNRQLISNPANANASPYGWHDTDGADGPEYSITRGNNVWAQDDFNGNDDIGYSPDGGATLNFDFYYLDDNDPVQDYEDAAITNLFYVNNIMHDVWYQYGFDEAAGNFQETNYTDEGFGGDFVYADAQDGSGVNNANFATPPEGYSPVMQMYLWNPVYLVAPLTINNSSMAGDYQISDNEFNPGHIDLPLYPNNISGNLVLAEDGTPDNLGCSAFTNAPAISGNIAVVRRGICNFTQKVLHAQDAGAIAIIVVNNQSGNIGMGGGADGIQIPAVSINMADGEALIATMANNSINVSITNPHKQLLAKDASFDNVIIAHEYGHGISTRLTGGSSNADCLHNAEQMGEGWSDWFGLMLTLKEDDVPSSPRGIGNYVTNQTTTGNGIRNAPYSTNFSINNFTYADTNNGFQISQPHGIGFVWSTILWDLTWALIEEHGFDPDLYNGTGGNNIAMQLVIDGLKLQPCNPGFVDGRDAILAADMAANSGANQCTIWQVFSNRGVGYSADQGSSFERNDQIEAFDMPPSNSCSMNVSEIGNPREFNVYPNPSNGVINISSSLQNNNEADLKIYDINGRLILTEQLKLNNPVNIDISHFSIGVYIIKISSEGNTYTTRIIRE